MSNQNNELEQWEKDEKTAKNIVITGIVTGTMWFVNHLLNSQKQRDIDIEIAECNDTIQRLQSKWFKSSEEKQELEATQRKKEQLNNRRK